jgi:small-conductance mechanosensitive channel
MHWWNYILQEDRLLWPCCILVGGVFAAWVLERIVQGRLRAWARTAQWGGPEIIANVARGMVLLWLTLVVVVVAADHAELDAHNEELIEKIIKVLWVISATTLVARALSSVVRAHLHNIPGQGTTSILTNVVTLATFLIGLLVTFQTLGINITPVLTAMGVGGLAVALALQDTLSNLFAGIQIILLRHIRSGDYIHIDGADNGFVADIGWRNTTVRSLDNNLVVVPNSKLASSIVTNYSLPERLLMVSVRINVAYANDLDRVETMAMEEAKATLAAAAGRGDFQPTVLFVSCTEISIGCEICVPVERFEDQFRVRHELLKRVHQRFLREGVLAPPTAHFPPQPPHLPAPAPPLPPSSPPPPAPAT